MKVPGRRDFSAALFDLRTRPLSGLAANQASLLFILPGGTVGSWRCDL